MVRQNFGGTSVSPGCQFGPCFQDCRLLRLSNHSGNGCLHPQQSHPQCAHPSEGCPAHPFFNDGKTSRKLTNFIYFHGKYHGKYLGCPMLSCSLNRFTSVSPIHRWTRSRSPAFPGSKCHPQRHGVAHTDWSTRSWQRVRRSRRSCWVLHRSCARNLGPKRNTSRCTAASES